MQLLHRLSHRRLSEISHGGGGVQRLSSAARVASRDETIRPPCCLVVSAEADLRHAMVQVRDGSEAWPRGGRAAAGAQPVPASSSDSAAGVPGAKCTESPSSESSLSSESDSVSATLGELMAAAAALRWPVAAVAAVTSRSGVDRQLHGAIRRVNAAGATSQLGSDVPAARLDRVDQPPGSPLGAGAARQLGQRAAVRCGSIRMSIRA